HAALPGQRIPGPGRRLGAVHRRRNAGLRPERGAARAMKRIAAILALLVGLVAVVAVTSGANDDGGAYKVRAIFDNASFLGPDDDVKASGVIIGKVAEVDLTEDNKAAVVVQIDNPAFQDFRKDASCII